MWYNFGFREALVVPKILKLKKREGRVGQVTQNIGAPSDNLHNQYTAQVVLGRGNNRATFNFLPEHFFEGSKAVK